ncbi:MAG: hypothetical protein Q8M15_14360 [Bacteroidota bacterium]|nr:hypothetical protein [Bacteroidota bacterium]
MGFKKICLFVAVSAFTLFVASAQCPGCKQALLKDYLLGSENTDEQMLVIQIIDKNIFADLKKNYPSDTVATLVYEMIQSSRDFESFSKKRADLFAFASYSVQDENTEALLFNVSRSTTYENYEKCMDACNAKIPGKVYAVLNRADENLFYVSVKFNSGSGASFVNLVLKPENAMILSQDASRYVTQVAMKLLKGKELFFTFKRSDKYNTSGFKMMVDGKELGNGYTSFKEAAPKAEISATLNITLKDSVKKFVKTETGLINSPNLYKVLSNDTACRRLRGFAVKEWCAVKNTIELPKLHNDKNVYYTNFSKLKSISEGKKEQAYGKYNEMSGLSKIQIIGPGNKTAKYEFVTTSGGCLWQWKADVYEFSEKLSKQQKPVTIKNRLFVLELPENLVEASITLKLNGTKYEMKAGSNNPDAMTYLISESRKKGIVRYVYFVL